MNEISHLTKNTNDLTDNLYSEGNKLIDITEDTVKKDYEGKGAIEEMVEIIKSLESENRNNTGKSNDVIVRGVRASGNAAEKIEASLSSIAKVEQEVNGVMEILIDQKKHIENMSKEIVDTDEILKIISETIINHVEDASVVDRQLEETIAQLVSYSKS